MTDTYIWTAVAIIALATAAIRFLPFVMFRASGKTPAVINKLGKMLPQAIMGMLVIYCLKDTSFAGLDGWLPALLGCVVVGAVHIWKRNTLLSILVGTITYMFLVQFVFPT